MSTRTRSRKSQGETNHTRFDPPCHWGPDDESLLRTFDDNSGPGHNARILRKPPGGDYRRKAPVRPRTEGGTHRSACGGWAEQPHPRQGRSSVSIPPNSA
jgi:hypothetical protein